MTQRRKIMLLGDIGVGKTSIIRRFVLGRFEGTYRGTIGFDLFTFEVPDVGDTPGDGLPVVIWDTDGNAGLRMEQDTSYVYGCLSRDCIAIRSDFQHASQNRAAMGLPFSSILVGRPAWLVYCKSSGTPRN